MGMTDFVAAEAGIRQLQARCVDAIWRKDAEALGECFALDGEWQLAAGAKRGCAEIVEFIGCGFSGFQRIFLTLGTPILEVGNGVASGRTYVTEDGALADGTPYRVIGIYFERFVEEGGAWRFAWRQFQAHYSGLPDLSGNWLDVPDCGPPPAMPPFVGSGDEISRPAAPPASET